MWKKPEDRKFEGVQHEKLRRKIDKKFNDIHDELSDCYYNKKPFRSYGILDKETFDKLHGLIFWMHDVEFHKENLKQSLEDKIPEDQYENIYDGETVVSKKSEESQKKIDELKNQGLELVI